MNSIKKKYKIVRELLSERVDHFELAKDPNLLCVVYWQYEIQEMGKKLSSMTAVDYLKLYSEGKLTSADTITRAKRRCLEVYPHLRDKDYEKRKGMHKKVVKEIHDCN